ncbi:MAG: hypothetical protein AVDCRST_MAG58-1204 [uncultured Rubrobacteraceae bacterium]|uniref:Uncharacterized protein n=1 Tax=uncultured Rubrobacteraceae bacterium TaxID=349277 RepID=A0A6J4R246_9ACTN|nr:MAG: hypothetical protein AVDCRST_MAG58-1204 [uncultured Rubrobacteraceae bacterium]
MCKVPGPSRVRLTASTKFTAALRSSGGSWLGGRQRKREPLPAYVRGASRSHVPFE